MGFLKGGSRDPGPPGFAPDNILPSLPTEACVSSAWVVFNGHCYHFNFTPTSWPDAQRRCVNLTSEGKAYLVQISGSQEQNFINGKTCE